MTQTTTTLTTVASDDLQAAKRTLAKQEVQAALAQEINEAYAAYMGETANVLALGLSIENKRIRLGTLLHTAKNTVGHGNFLTWTGENCPNLSHRSLTGYMAYAKAANYRTIGTLDNLKDYHKVLVRLGLKEPADGHGPQRLHDYNPFALFTKAVGKTRETITSIFERKPIEQWALSEREQLKQQLEPLHNLYAQL